MATYKYNGYTLRMFDTGEYDKLGKRLVRYVLRDPSQEIVFKGSDFAVPPGNDPVGVFAASELLGFLTLTEGDTDEEYFDNYTPRQLQFRDSEANELQWWQMELEDTAQAQRTA